MKKLVAILFLWSLSITFTMSQDSPERLLPKLLGASNTGKEFYLTFHPAWEDSDTILQKENFVRIYISSQFKTMVKLEIPGLNIVQTKVTIPNEVIEFVLKPSEAQVYSKGDGGFPIPPKPEQVWKGRAIKITADDPIICYGVLKYQYFSDGYLALPVHTWGKQYQVASYVDPTNNTSQFLPSQTSIIAAYDNTKVTFRLGGSGEWTQLKLENGDKLKYNEVVRKTLNAGDVWLLAGLGSSNDLTGSIVTSDKNVAVISGNFCAYVPDHIAACNYIIEQENPTDFWGNNYFLPTIIDRRNAPIIKIFAKEPYTKVNVDGVPIFSIATPGGMVGTGFIEARASVAVNSSPVVLKSDKAINVVLYNPGQQDDNVPSDPFQMNIISEEQFQTEATFNTPGIKGGEGFIDNYLNIILKSKDGTIPDDMMIGTIVSDTVQLMKLKDFTKDTLVAFKFDTEDTDRYLHYSLTMKLQNDGLYKLKADIPFGVYSYGYGKYDAYGYPYTTAMIDQTSRDTLAPEINVDSMGNGKYSGYIRDRGLLIPKANKNKDDLQSTEDIAGLSFVEMINAMSYNYKFIRDSFIPGKSDQLDYKLTKIDIEKDSKAVLFASDRRGNDTTIVFEDIVTERAMTPLIIGDTTDFGILKNGQKKQLSLKLKNQGLKNSKSVLELVFGNKNSEFKIISPTNFPLSLNVNQEIDVIVEFTAGETDSIFTNIIGVKTSDTTLYRIEIKATVGNPTIKTSDVDFSSIMIGNPAEKSDITITNSGKTVLEINKIDFPVNTAFNVQVTPPSTTNPLKVDANKSISIVSQFEPKVPGELKDSIIFYSDGKIIKNITYLTGKAIINSVEEFERKYGVINLSVKDNKISFRSGNDITLNSFSIYDLAGKIIQAGSPATLLNNYNITISNISGSVYFIELNTQYGKVVKKIVVE